MKKEVFKGRVVFFDKSTGQGLIYSDSHKESFFFHFTAISGNTQTVKKHVLEKNELIGFTLYKNFFMAQVERVYRRNHV